MQPYKKLLTYWFSVIVYDLTVEFTNTYIKSYKLKDQLDGAARSGKQNIVEGSDAMQVSVKSAIKLTGVAKASFEELIGDYEDFLRQRDLEQWPKSDKRVLSFRVRSARIVRNLSNLRKYNKDLVEKHLYLKKDPEYDANLILTLCHQATYLLHRQILSLEEKHRTEGGLTPHNLTSRLQVLFVNGSRSDLAGQAEKLYHARISYRKSRRASKTRKDYRGY